MAVSGAPQSGVGGLAGRGAETAQSGSTIERESAGEPSAMSSLARVAYMSTYSWPDSDMSSYITSSVTDLKTKRSFSSPS